MSFPPMSFIPGLRDQACDAYIKRVVALPGEIVSVNSRGEVLINNKIIFAIEEKSNLIAMNIAIHPSAKPMKYPIVAFIIFVKYVNKDQFYLKSKLEQNMNFL